LLARFTTLEELGLYTVAFAALRLVRASQEGIFLQAVNTLGAALDKSDFQEYISSTTITQLVYAVVISSLVILVLTAFPAGTLPLPENHNLILWMTFLGWQLNEYFRRVFYTKSRVPSALFVTIIYQSIRMLVMFIYLYQGNLFGFTAVYAIAVGSLVSLFPAVWNNREYLKAASLPILDVWRKNWSFGKWISGATISSWLSTEFYPVLTASIVNLAAAGVYKAMQNVLAPVHVLLTAVDTYISPRAASVYDRYGLNPLVEYLKKAYTLIAIPVVGLFILVILFPEGILQILYGGRYLEFRNTLYFMVVFYAAVFLIHPYLEAFKAVKSTRSVFLAFFISIISMFTLGAWMLTEWGVYGAFTGSAVGALITLLIVYLNWRRFLGEQQREEI
jgi:O-antigen/teichoic acid export membrane protein